MRLPPRRPRVLEAVAELDPDGAGVVCTMGRPNLVTQELLTRARDAGCALAYHGDFDWPGVAMANAAQARFGASGSRRVSEDAARRSPQHEPWKR